MTAPTATTTTDPNLAIMRAKMQPGSYYTKMDLMTSIGLPLAEITQALNYLKTAGELKTRLCGSMYYSIVTTEDTNMNLKQLKQYSDSNEFDSPEEALRSFLPTLDSVLEVTDEVVYTDNKEVKEKLDKFLGEDWMVALLTPLCSDGAWKGQRQDYYFDSEFDAFVVLSGNDPHWVEGRWVELFMESLGGQHPGRVIDVLQGLAKEGTEVEFKGVELDAETQYLLSVVDGRVELLEVLEELNYHQGSTWSRWLFRVKDVEDNEERNVIKFVSRYQGSPDYEVEDESEFDFD